jgi:sulfite exporter TauE/SafE
MILNGDLVCPHCGHTQWGRIVSYFLIGFLLMGIGYKFCSPGFWRWVWWILNTLLTLPSIGGIIKSFRWQKEPR